jgi:hypothetical protein
VGVGIRGSVGVKSVIESTREPALQAKATGCCGASEIVVAKRGFRAHSQFNVPPMPQPFSPSRFAFCERFSTPRATGGYL